MDLILMTAAMQPTAEVLPALGLLQHRCYRPAAGRRRAGRSPHR
jgi:hypothetical protein